jgi:hypothetical protein
MHIDSGIRFKNDNKYYEGDLLISRMYVDHNLSQIDFTKNNDRLIIRPYKKEFELIGDIKTLAYHFAILIYDSISLFSPEDVISKIFTFDEKIGILSCLIDFPQQSRCQEFIDKVNEIYPKIPGLLALA